MDFKRPAYIYALGVVIVILLLCYIASVYRGSDSFEGEEQSVEEVKSEESKPEEKKEEAKPEEKKPEVAKIPEEKLNESQVKAIQNLKPTLSMCNAYYGPAPA